MKRRKFLSLFAGVTASLSRTAPAQQRDRRKVVAMVSAFSEQEMEPLRTALIGKLRELGWREGENLEFDLRLTGGDPSAMADAAAALV